MQGEENLSIGCQSVRYITGNWWEWRGWVNEGGDRHFLDLPTFLLPPPLARVLRCSHSPGSDVHHCLSLGISFFWPASGSSFFLSYDIALQSLTYLFFPKCLTGISPSFQCCSLHNSTVTHSVLWLIVTQTALLLRWLECTIMSKHHMLF